MPFTVEVHHHILPDFSSRETNDAQNPVGGTAPPPPPTLPVDTAALKRPA
jgi:hypothetical protein